MLATTAAASASSDASIAVRCGSTSPRFSARRAEAGRAASARARATAASSSLSPGTTSFTSPQPSSSAAPYLRDVVEHLARDRGARLQRQQAGHRTARIEPDLHLREEPPRVVRPHREVAVDRPRERAPDRPAAHRRDHRCIAEHEMACDLLDGIDECDNDRLVRVEHRALLDEVVAGTERPARPGQDDRSDPFVRVRARERRVQTVEQRRVDRVETGRAVQGDDAHAAVVDAENGFAHAGPLASGRLTPVRQRLRPPVRRKIPGQVATLAVRPHIPDSDPMWRRTHGSTTG